MAVATNPYQQYKEQALSTLSPGEVLVKLYEELSKQMLVAIRAIERSDLATANDALIKTQSIISTLAASLDMRYPVSKQLRELYIFLAQQMMKANIQKDTMLIEQCIPLVKELRDSFEQADKINRRNQHAHSGGRAI